MRALSKAHGLALSAGASVVILLGAWGCASWPGEGLDPTTMPPTVQPDYALFAQRCSKCHSLARPLTSGIDEDAYWVDYVARMRRQPSSGISEEDTVGILRFLHYFSLEEKKKHVKVATVEVVTAPAVVVTAPAVVVVPPAPASSGSAKP